MNWFKRLVVILYSLMSACVIVYLGSYWFEYDPVLRFFSSWSGTGWFKTMVVIFAAVALLGIMVSFVKALIAPASRKRLQVKGDNGSYSVDRKALTRVVSETIAHNPNIDYRGTKVKLKGGANPTIRLAIKAIPLRVEKIDELSDTLRTEVRKSLGAFSGVDVSNVDIRFKSRRSSKRPLSAPVTEAAGGTSSDPVAEMHADAMLRQTADAAGETEVVDAPDAAPGADGHGSGTSRDHAIGHDDVDGRDAVDDSGRDGIPGTAGGTTDKEA